LLTRKGTEALIHVERVLDDAVHALSAQAAPSDSFSALGSGVNDASGRNNTLTTAADRNAPVSSRGE
jgi:hypothetical protein